MLVNILAGLKIIWKPFSSELIPSVCIDDFVMNLSVSIEALSISQIPFKWVRLLLNFNKLIFTSDWTGVFNCWSNVAFILLYTSLVVKRDKRIAEKSTVGWAYDEKIVNVLIWLLVALTKYERESSHNEFFSNVYDSFNESTFNVGGKNPFLLQIVWKYYSFSSVFSMKFFDIKIFVALIIELSTLNIQKSSDWISLATISVGLIKSLIPICSLSHKPKNFFFLL